MKSCVSHNKSFAPVSYEFCDKSIIILYIYEYYNIQMSMNNEIVFFIKIVIYVFLVDESNFLSEKTINNFDSKYEYFY